MDQLDQFLEYLYIVEETTTELTTSQVQKLETIQTKVAEIVKKVEHYADSIGNLCHSSQPEKVQVTQPERQLELAIRENSIMKFSEFEEISEKIAHRGNKWVVLNKKGDKVLGTHSSREKAVKQLQAIEISKAKHAG